MLKIVSALLRPSFGVVRSLRGISAVYAELSVPLCFARALHGVNSQVRLDMTWVCADEFHSLDLHIKQNLTDLYIHLYKKEICVCLILRSVFRASLCRICCLLTLRGCIHPGAYQQLEGM
jgi:hypothetical protein